MSKSGKLRWIIRDAQDSLAGCYYAKLMAFTYPPPPADNWPVRFGIHFKD